MSGVKPAYSELAKKFVQSTDEESKDYLEKAKERKQKFKDNWKEVDIDKLVEKFAPHGDAPHMEGNKIVVNDSESHIQIVADPVGYVRIMDTSNGVKKQLYLDENGVPVKSYTQRKGESKQEFKDRKMSSSHFTIKKNRS